MGRWKKKEVTKYTRRKVVAWCGGGRRDNNHMVHGWQHHSMACTRKKNITLCTGDKDVAWHVGRGRRKYSIASCRRGGENMLAVNQPIIFHELVHRVSNGNGSDDGFSDSEIHTDIV